MTDQERLKNQLEQFATDGLTPEEDRQLASLLSKWKGGKISTPVFTELARIIPQPIVEVVLFRESDGVLETLLIPRPKDDIVWPGMVHTPGTALRASDWGWADKNPLQGAFERIGHGELHNEFEDSPIFAGRLYRDGDRGPEVVEIYIAELAQGSELMEGQEWCPVDKLSENPKFIQGQLGQVVLAAEFLKGK